MIDAAIVPSHFALARLRELGAPLATAHVLPHPVRGFAATSGAAAGSYGLFAGRLEPEKGLGVAIAACASAGLPLVVAGEGSQRAAFSGEPGVRFAGQVAEAELVRLRAGARFALMPSLTSETFGLAAAEAMAAGVPVAASAIGALGELVPADWLSAPGDAGALAATITRLAADPDAGERALTAARELLDPGRLAARLGAVYAGEAHG
jgi:glycosyltransferase involved in cell wall biosynthesis